MKKLTREQVIEAVRSRILTMVDSEHSFCQVAAKKGLLCKGFHQYSDEELKKKYDWLVERTGSTDRKELEEMANRWRLARQIMTDTRLSCDAESIEHEACNGWDEFSNEQLATAYRELVGEEVVIE